MKRRNFLKTLSLSTLLLPFSLVGVGRNPEKQKPEEEREKPLTEKVKVIGLGGGGAKIIEALHAKGKPEFNCRLIDTYKHKMEIPFLLFGEKHFQGLDARNNDYVKEVVPEEIDSIRQFIKKEDSETLFILVAALGGATVGGLASVVLDEARKMGYYTACVGTMPFNFEGKNKARKAAETLKELERSDHLVVSLKNQDLIKKNKRVTLNKAFQYSDEEAIGVIEDLADYRNVKNWS